MSEKPPLGRFEPFPLRGYWEHEAHHFTPWLADHIDLLGEALGLNLEVEGTEVGVGPYRADIFARDIDANSPVLVENQLEVTDLAHLGQLMTYAAGLDAATVIWVAADFIEQHRAALEWFNRVTLEDVNFFGVRVELWSIGDSAPAPRFEIVVKPNEWSKKMSGARKAAGGPRAPIYDQYEAYWAGLTDFLRKSDYRYPLPKPSARNWVGSRAPLPKGVRITLAVSAGREPVVSLYLLFYEDKAPGISEVMREGIADLVETVGRPADHGPNFSETGGDVGWRFDSAGLEAEDHSAEYEWFQTTITALTPVLNSLVEEADQDVGELGPR